MEAGLFDVHQFRLLSTVVRAAHVDQSGSVVLDGQTLIGNAGTWIVIDAQGAKSTWSDADFRKNFEPANEAAAAYLERARG